MSDLSIGLGTGKILAVVACDAQHHALAPGAIALDRVRCLMSHAVAGMFKRYDHDHPAFETFVSACGCVSGHLTHTILACVVPPTVRTKARFMPVHRLFTWGDRVLHLSPSGGAKTGSTLATLRACLDQLPACKALITRFRRDAAGLLACQQMVKRQGLSHATLAPCEPLLATMPSAALRRECHASLVYQLEIATTLGLEHIGLPISSDAIASLCGVAKRHGVGETQDASRMALRLPAFCGVPTREEAQQVLEVSVARQQCSARFLRARFARASHAQQGFQEGGSPVLGAFWGSSRANFLVSTGVERPHCPLPPSQKAWKLLPETVRSL